MDSHRCAGLELRSGFWFYYKELTCKKADLTTFRAYFRGGLALREKIRAWSGFSFLCFRVSCPKSSILCSKPRVVQFNKLS